MKRVILNYLVMATFAVSAALMSCGNSGSSSVGKSSGKIKMTTEQSGNFSFYLAGDGIATVDWGDGSEKVMLTLNESRTIFSHTYPNATIRTITINGDNITGLICGLEGRFTSLDMSRCTELASLSVHFSSLTSFDVSKNTALTNFYYHGQLSTAALNALFETLHSNAGEKSISIFGNPGNSDCDRSIAERKGWKFRDY